MRTSTYVLGKILPSKQTKNATTPLSKGRSRSRCTTFVRCFACAKQPRWPVTGLIRAVVLSSKNAVSHRRHQQTTPDALALRNFHRSPLSTKAVCIGLLSCRHCPNYTSVTFIWQANYNKISAVVYKYTKFLNNTILLPD